MNGVNYFVRFIAASLFVVLACAAGYAQKKKQKIAVLSFDYTEVSTKAYGPVGRRIADYAIDKLVKSGAYTVVEREVVDKILREAEFRGKRARG